MELQIGHIKNLTHKSLYESDYFLFYTNDLSKVDCIINDVTEFVFKLLDGAFISYSVLNSKDVVELVKELYGVNYFNSTQASLQMFSRADITTVSPFDIKGILWNNGEDQELNNREINKLRNITTSIINETMDSKDVSLKNAIYREEEKLKVGVDFDSLASGNVANKQSKKIMLNKDIHKKNDKVTLTKDNENIELTADDDNEFLDF